MLIEFKVRNFLSFKDMQVLRMAQMLDCNQNGTSYGGASDMMFIYGPNGSGKSNLIKAMTFARNIILYRSGGIEAKPYKSGPSYFEYVFSVDDGIYSYGFEINVVSYSLESEWLYLLKPEEDLCLFEKEYDEGATLIDGESPEKSRKRNFCELDIRKIGPDDSLWPHAKKVMCWFSESLFIENSRIRDEIIPVSENFIEYLGKTLAEFDTGITEVVEERFRNTSIPKNLIRRIPGNGMLEQNGDFFVIVVGGETKRYWLIHVKKKEVENEYLEVRLKHENGHITTMENESLGTLRILQILSLFSMIQRNEEENKDGIVIADELECSVHTIIFREFIKTFKSLNPTKGQLIATTHRMDVLRNDIVNDEDVSFIDMDRKQKKPASVIYTLHSFDPAIRDRYHAYKDGRMGAIPVFTDPDMGDWK